MELRLTTSLGRDFLKKPTVAYNPKTGSIEPVADKLVFYKWLRSLVVCAGLSRLAYSPTDVFCRGLAVLDYSPGVINDAIGVLEYNTFSMVSERKVTDQNTYNSEEMMQTPGYTALYKPINTSNKKVVGAFFPKCGCHIIRRPDGQVYVVFKGSSALKDFINDLKSIMQTPINKMPHCTDAPPEATTGLGFWNHMKDEAQSIVDKLRSICTGEATSRIVVTGHSLGGAQATLMSLILGKAMKGTIPVACVTFGAPVVFSASGRNYYNALLKDSHLTLDRITAYDKGLKKFAGVTPGSGADIITSLGSPLVHPGYTTLNTEFYAASRTGRAFHMDDVSKVYTGEASKGFFSKLTGSGVGELPNDDAFWKGFELLEEEKAWSAAQFKTSDPKRRTSPSFLALLYPDAISPSSMAMPLEATASAATPDPALAKELATVSASVPVEEEPVPAAAGRKQRGGAFALSKAGEMYKAETGQYAPNRLNFQCNKKQSLNFCHGSYMLIGFMGALRMFPVVRMGQTPVRRMEPTVLMNLYKNGTSPRIWSGPVPKVPPPPSLPPPSLPPPPLPAAARHGSRRNRNNRRRTRKLTSRK